MKKKNRREFLGTAGAIGGTLVLGGFGAHTHAKQKENRMEQDKAPATPATPERPALPVTIAMLQMLPDATNQQANLAKADDFCRQAAKQQADIALMPEMWNIGYTGYMGEDEARAEWTQNAVPKDGPWVTHFAALAKELGIAIACTYLEKTPAGPRNTCTVFDRHGKEVLTYAKVHTCDFANFEAACVPGEEWFVKTLDVKSGPLELGVMICFDREFPESARTLMLKGAEIVLTPNACLLDDIRLAQFGTRALENSMAFVMTNYPAPLHGGRSVAYHLDGRQVALADEKEQILQFTYDMNHIRDYRERTIWGNAWRRPHRYGLLTSMEKDPVWKRENAFGEPFVAAKR